MHDIQLAEEKTVEKYQLKLTHMDLAKLDNLMALNNIDHIKDFIDKKGVERFNFLLMLSVAKNLCNEVRNEVHDVN